MAQAVFNKYECVGENTWRDGRIIFDNYIVFSVCCCGFKNFAVFDVYIVMFVDVDAFQLLFCKKFIKMFECEKFVESLFVLPLVT